MSELEPVLEYGLGPLRTNPTPSLIDYARWAVREYAVYERDGAEFTFDIRLPSGKECPTWLGVHEEHGVVELRVFPSAPFNSLQRSRVIEILRWITERLVFGAFVYDQRDSIYYRHAVRIDNSGNVREQVERLLNSCVFAMQLWASSYARLHEVQFPAAVVVELACIENEVAKPIGLSKAATKSLLRII